MNLLAVTIFLCGDVMTGRGIDQVLPYPSPPRIYEPYVTDAREYVRLAEKDFRTHSETVQFHRGIDMRPFMALPVGSRMS